MYVRERWAACSGTAWLMRRMPTCWWRRQWISKAAGWLTARDASTGAVRWRYHSERQMIAAVTATAGGAVFTGELTGTLLALASATGAMLYRHNVGEQLGAGIITYSVSGRQFVGVASGTPSAYWLSAPGGKPHIHVFALPGAGQ